MINQSKTTTGETWASILTTWASETKTWLGVGSFMTNNSTVSASITNVSRAFLLQWSVWDTQWEDNTILQWGQLSGDAMTNISKPI